MPFFSICIPNFNYSKYLKLTIESVLSQSFQDFEIIVSDNASTDDSIQMVKEFRDPRIKLIENTTNLGFSPNLDKCTQDAQGEFMILLSSDDVMLQGALDSIYQIIKSNQDRNIVVMTACAVIDSNGEKIGSKRAMTGDVYSYISKNKIPPLFVNSDLYYEYYSSKSVLTAILTGTFQPAGQFLATCYPSTIFRTLDGYRSILSAHPDAHFSHRLLFQSPIICYVHRELFGYRVHDANNLSATTKMSNIKYLTDNYLITQLYDKSILDKINLNTRDLQKTFIHNIVFNTAGWSLLKGKTIKGIRFLAFGISAYPALVLSSYKFYLLNLFVFFSPLNLVIYSLLKFYRFSKFPKPGSNRKS